MAAGKIVNTFENGLVRLDNKTKQPKGTYSYALNAVPNDEITDRTSKTNERGFDEYIKIKEDPYNIIGYQWLGDEEYVFFIKDLEGHTAPFNEIWYVDIKEELYELKYSNLGLNFKEAYPITSTYRTDYRNNRLIYWVDGLNDDRIINIDSANVSSLDITMLSMNSSEVNPTIKVIVNDNGGAVKSGQYFVVTAYKDENNFITDNSNFTNAVSVVSSSYTIIDPSEYVSTNGSELDVVTSKKLDITLTNIDQKFKSVILYIVQVTDTFTKIYTSNELTINGSSLEYSFTGLNTAEDTSITVNDLLVTRINYYASNIINQKENRLIRGNSKIKETLINYQQIANQIKVGYKIQTENVANPSLIYDYSIPALEDVSSSYRQSTSYAKYAINPEYLAQTGNSLEISSKTFMRDEVYALGVSFELTDGSETDVFHIPGRTTEDILDEPPGFGEYNRAYNGQIDWDTDIVDGNPRWLERNTSISRTGNVGSLAYWRSDEIYPDGYGYPTDGEKDAFGNSYVRHHKMPSDVREPIQQTIVSTKSGPAITYNIIKRNLVLVLNNIQIPTEYDNIISKIRFHYVKRTNENKSIISKGLLYNTGFVNDTIRQSPQFNKFGDTPSVHNQFISPEIDFNFKQFPITADKWKSGYVSKGYLAYFGKSGFVSGGSAATDTYYFLNIANNYNYNLNSGNAPYTGLQVGTTAYFENTIPIEANYSKTIDNVMFVDSNSSGIPLNSDVGNVYDFSGEENTSMISFPLTELLDIDYTDYPELDYDDAAHGVYPVMNYSADATGTDITIISDIYYDSVIYGSLVRENRFQYNNINQLIYVSTGSEIIHTGNSVYNNVDIKNGDSFIDIHYSKKGYSVLNKLTDYSILRIDKDGEEADVLGPVGQITSNNYVAYFVETDLNIRLRNTDSNIPEKGFNYWPISPLDSADIRDSFDKKATGAEYYNIYTSYNQQNIKEYFSNNRLLIDYSNTDANKYANRLVYSDKQNYEDEVDNFRITRANNYKDLPMDRGQITQSFIKDDKFFVLTRDALFNVYASNKALQTIDGENMTVGTGEFFGLEPVELISIKGGFGGTSSKFSLIESPYGYLFVDVLKDKIILYNDTLKDINVGGLKEDFKLGLFKQFKDLQIPEKFDNPVLGAGIISIYDPRLHRFIITKKDYIGLEPITDNYQGLFNPETTYEIGDIVAKDGVLVEITDVVIIEEHLIFKTLSTDNPYEFNLNSEGTTITIEARTSDNTVIDSTTGTASSRELDLSGAVSESDIMLMNPPTLITTMNVTDGQVISINSTIYPNLTGITANNNLLTSINTNSNPSLTQLRVEFNSISSIDVTNNIYLTHLFINDNNISSLDLTNNEDLVYLQADNNTISTINLANNGELLWCLLGNNGLSTINLSNNPNITWLRVIDNNLTTLDTSFCAGLTRLEAKNNNISSFDFSNNPLIEILDIGDNNLSTLDTSNLSNLEVLYISRNSISSVNFSNNIGITHIQISENNLSTLNISMLENLESIDCTKNDNLTTLDISNNDNLTSLRCGECDFTVDTADPAIIDAIIIKMDQNITSGGTLHYDTLVPGGVQPTSASLAAYNSLVSKGCNLQGKVPS